MFATGGVMAACAGSACMTATCSCCGAVGGAIAKISARALYVALFVLTTALAVVMRDYAKPMLAKLPWVVHAAGGAAGFEPEDEWFGAQAVYRVSLGAFVFFAAMSLLLADVRDRADPRDAMIQHGNWTLKVVAWITCLVFCLFFLGAHSGVITAYVWFARVASGLFLCAQSVILLDFAFLWNASWLRRSEHATERGDEKAATGWIMGLVFGTLVLFGGAVALFAFLYRWYVQGDAAKCATNAWLISVVVVFVVVCAAASAHPAAAERGASVLPAAVVAAYCAYLTHAALASEPQTKSAGEVNVCVPARASAGGAGRSEPAELAGAALTLLSVAYSALRCGSADFFGDESGSSGDGGDGVSSRGLLDPGDGDGHAGDGDDSDVGGAGAAFPAGPVRYSYSFFHGVFALASAYLGMLLTGWGARGDGDGDAGPGDIRDVDSGWASVWVKIVSAWITSLLYGWTVAAPFVMEDRDFL